MKYLLFVCTENSARSQMAEALFNFHNMNPEYAAISAGIKPTGEMKREAVEAMKELGIDISKGKPKKLTREMIKGATRIFTMGCIKGCPVTPSEKTEDWDLEDPVGKPVEKYREVRDEIGCRIRKLVSEIR